MGQCNDLSNTHAGADASRGAAGSHNFEDLQRLKENHDVIGHPAHQKHTHYGKYQLYSSVLFGIPGYEKHDKDFDVTKNHDGEADKEAHDVLAEVSPQLPKFLGLFWIEWLALGEVIVWIYLQGGKFNVRSCNDDRYGPDRDAGDDSKAKCAVAKGCNSMDDGYIAVQAHESHK